MNRSIRTIVGGGLFAAIVVVLQLVGGMIRFGPFSISLVLLPIVVGAAVYGWQIGCWLGFVFGLTVLLTGDAGVFLAVNAVGAILTVFAKGIGCGLAAGLCYKALAKIKPILGIVAAAIAAPIANTGIFLIGCRLFFWDTICEWATAAGFANAGAYAIMGLAGVNFLLEMAVNLVLAPAAERLITHFSKNFKKA